jgi:triosephosphate isomerase
MKKIILASNFKTNHTRKSTKDYCKKLSDILDGDEDIYIFPPATALDNFNYKSIKIGTQNSYPTEKGSFTGEIGLEQLNEFNINTVLIGHSERRHILKESQNLIIEKFNFFKKNDFNIIYCIGEPLEIREKGLEETINYCFKQLDGIDLNYANLVIAYEPVWAIGTGVSASNKDIQETHKALKEKIKSPLLYGGSVKVKTLKDILNIKNVDGVLVGTASWDIDNFIKMVEISKSLD